MERRQTHASTPNATGDLEAMAGAMERVARETADVPVTTPALTAPSRDCEAMVREVGQAFRDIAAGVEAKNFDEIEAAQSPLDEAVEREDPLVAAINKVCVH